MRFGMSHLLVILIGSFGKTLQPIYTGIAQDGNSSSITLDTLASSNG